jgi:anti-sigma regulatory factor (Ser/Thr protein kinase)
MQTGFSVRLHNRLLELDRLAEAVEAFGEAHGLPPKLVYQIGLVLDELLTNTISYGYRDEDEHGIEVGMAQEGDHLRFVLTDDAAPFDPLSAKAPDLASPVDTRRVGGLGVHLVRSIMDRVAYERVGNMNRLVLEKDIE